MTWDDGYDTAGGTAMAPADNPWGASAPAPAGGYSAAYDDNGRDSGDYGNDRAHDFDAQSNRSSGVGGGGGECYRCGQFGHNKADCPDKPPMTCNHCGQEGHMRKECPDAPRMTCNICGDPDHMRKDCPQKPAETCRNCQEEGHEVADCKNPRKIDYTGCDEMTDTAAWSAVVEAIQDRDAIELKSILMSYLKHHPDLTYIQLEEAFRRQNLKVYIIALEREVLPTITFMDLQGNLGKKYCVSFRFSDKAGRPREFDAWPKTREENLERLVDAGEPVPNFIPRCSNCKEMGHISKTCPVEKTEPEKAGIHCFNCEGEGHRVRDCPLPRKDRFACRNCGQSGHKAADCTEPRSAENVECNKCHEMGHFSRDCPQGDGGGRACHNCGDESHMARDCPEPRKMFCRNCDGEGHTARECPEPVDVSKIKCNNCGEMGHKKYQCTQDPQKASGNHDFGYNGGGNANYDAGGDFGYGGGNEPTPAAGGSSW